MSDVPLLKKEIEVLTKVPMRGETVRVVIPTCDVVGALKKYIEHSTHINCLTKSHSECWCVKEFWKVKSSTDRKAIFEYWLANRIFGVKVFGE